MRFVRLSDFGTVVLEQSRGIDPRFFDGRPHELQSLVGERRDRGRRQRLAFQERGPDGVGRFGERLSGKALLEQARRGRLGRNSPLERSPADGRVEVRLLHRREVTS